SNQSFDGEPLIYDHAETSCVTGKAEQYQMVRRSAYISAIQFDVFPRADKKFYVGFVKFGSNGATLLEDKFSVLNPARSETSARWTPDALPVTKSDGDLSVTLTKVISGAQLSDENRGPLANKHLGFQINFDVLQKAQITTNWSPVQMEISDSTGNHLKSSMGNQHPKDDPAGFYCNVNLWRENPWKVRLEFSQNSSFDADEIWTVTNVPIVTGNAPDVRNFWTNSPAVAETMIHGIDVKIFPAAIFTNVSRGYRTVSFMFKTDPPAESEGLQFKLLKVTDDRENQIPNPQHAEGNGRYSFLFVNPPDTRTLNATIALHKSRFVEFIVQPTKQ
ncbi:MAG TPA: hypothetical protein VN516_10375, partial [Candidatus Baltobacteraceae bacterium]|nr:hypothetical protein [Candidatus Baltobacteraceae bacterium]